MLSAVVLSGNDQVIRRPRHGEPDLCLIGRRGGASSLLLVGDGVQDGCGVVLALIDVELFSVGNRIIWKGGGEFAHVK